jgi:hypothetical protein
MGLLNKLTQNGSNLTQWDGSTPGTMGGANPQSRLHYEYSINGNPSFTSKPKPSQLDLDGNTPAKYTDNLPG